MPRLRGEGLCKGLYRERGMWALARLEWGEIPAYAGMTVMGRLPPTRRLRLRVSGSRLRGNDVVSGDQGRRGAPRHIGRDSRLCGNLAPIEARERPIPPLPIRDLCIN